MADDERGSRGDLPEPGEVVDATPDRGAVRTAEPGLGRKVTIISLRVVRGLVGLAAAVLVVAAVGFVPLPAVGIDPLGVRVQPQPADLSSVCAGALLRLGDDTGANAGEASAIGTPEVTVAVQGGDAETSPLPESDAGTGGTDRAPRLLKLAAGDTAALAAAQSQSAPGEGGLRGLAASACAEPTASAWLVGGATTVGRTTLLLLANPTSVAAQVSVRLWGESGPVSTATGEVVVAPGAQAVIPLAGLAPDLASPIVHVEARGGQVIAALQTSVIRVIDPGGVDLVGASGAPARERVVPAVRIFDELGVSSALGIADYADLEAIARVGNPGLDDATVEVSLTPTVAGGVATSFEIEVQGGTVVDVPLSSALELGEAPIPDGSYTVSLRSDEPIVAGVRASTAPVGGSDAGGSPIAGAADLAWFPSAPALRGDVLLAVADAPSPVLVVVNPDNAERTLALEPVAGGEPIALTLPAAASASLALQPGAGYLLRATDGLRAGISFADTGRLAGYALTTRRPADTPIVVRP